MSSDFRLEAGIARRFKTGVRFHLFLNRRAMPASKRSLTYELHNHLPNRRRSFADHLFSDRETGDSLDDPGRDRRRDSGGLARRRRLLVVEQSTDR